MIEIPPPPTPTPCVSCFGAVVHLRSPRRGAWVAFTTDPADRNVLRVHACRPEPRQRNLYSRDPDAAGRHRKGRALVDQALAERERSNT